MNAIPPLSLIISPPYSFPGKFFGSERLNWEWYKSALVKVCFTKTTICRREWNRMLYSDRARLTGEWIDAGFMFPSQTSRRPCGCSGACGGSGRRRQMGLLHMGQTLRISNHFSRHLRKADRWEMSETSFCHFKGRQSYMQRSSQKLSGSKKETDDRIASVRVVKQDWTERHTGCLYSSQVLVILIDKCVRERQISLKAMSSTSHLR